MKIYCFYWDKYKQALIKKKYSIPDVGSEAVVVIATSVVVVVVDKIEFSSSLVMAKNQANEQT